MRANIATGDLFTVAGAKNVQRTGVISGADLDPTKIKALALTPVQALVKRCISNCQAIETNTKQIVARLEAEIKTEQQQRERPGARTQDLTPSGLESGDGASSRDKIRQRQMDLGVARTLLETVGKELDILKAGKFTKLEDTGVALHMLQDRPDRVFSSMLKKQIWAKYKSNNETASQMMQRFGQAWHLGVFGSAGSVIFGKLVTAIMGGTSQVNTRTLLGLLLLNVAQSATGAFSQSAAINAKNHRRANAEQVGNRRQLLNSVMAAPRVLMAHHKGNNAVTQANKALDDHAIANLVRTYVS
ncbi:MAG: hypothetical protein EOP38_31855, partial [Rubrivivax sp.]